MTREQVLELIRTYKLIVIVRGTPREKLCRLAEAVFEGGVRLLEVAFDQRGTVSDEETCAMIRTLSEHFGDRMAIGAGTVLKKEQVRMAKEAGCSFIISPDVCGEVIEETRALQMVSVPGAMTPTEVMTAVRFGADAVKLFPAGELGPGYVKALRTPLSDVPLLAVGGINKDNLPAFSEAGAAGFGIGSMIVKKELIAAEDYRGITEVAREAVNLLNE